MYKLNNQKNILQHIWNSPANMQLFFNENFNESIHDNYREFFKAVEGVITGVFTEFPHISLNDKMEKIYGALRFVHFINAKDVND